MTTANEVTGYEAPRAIRVMRRGEAPFELSIYPDGQYSFGRDRSCTVVFSDGSVSRDHGLLSCRDGIWMYRDKGSSNGSWLADRLDASDAQVEEAEKLTAGHATRVAAGQSVILGNKAGRILFLKDPVKPLPSQSESKASVELERELTRHARHKLPLFLLGPTGSGKNHSARRIHDLGQGSGNFVTVDCGALPRSAQDLRSELLGHVRGAYTGADQPRRGKLAHADGGTLFLDEVESLSAEAQALLLNLIDGTGDFAPLGATAGAEVKRPVFRLITASKVPLSETALREDLCNRLVRGGIILMPTLEERRADIPHLVQQMVEGLNQELQLDATLDPSAVEALQRADWPGHLRELEGVVRTAIELACADAAEPTAQGGQTGQFRAVAMPGKKVSFERVDGAAPRRAVVRVVLQDIEEQLFKRAIVWGRAEKPQPEAGSPGPVPRKRPKDYTRDEVEQALQRNAHVLVRTAEALGMSVNTLKARMRALQLEPRV